MAGLDADTSSYVKPPALPAQKSVLDQVGQYQQLESGGLTISKQKLDLINTQFGLMNQELSTLANDPSITKEQAAKRLSTFANTYKFPAEVTSHMLNELQEAKDVPTFAKTSALRGLNELERINKTYGVPGYYGNGQTDTPVVTSPMLNGGVPRQVGPPIQRQIPVDTPVIDPNTNQPRLQGPTPAVTPPGTAAGPQPLPSYVRPIQTIPIAPTPPSNFRSALSTDTPNNIVAQRGYPAPSGPTTGLPPLFEEGKKMLAVDQAEASNRMMAAKPAMQALPLMQTKGFLSGPGTEGFTKAVSALKAWGLVDTAVGDDPTAIRQEVNKKLAQYVRGSAVGQRSDADQALKEAGSPSAKVQILPALIKLTKDAIALDRVQAAMPNAFKDKDLSKYGNHRSTFPQSVDEKAFTLDLEPEEKSKELVDGMAKKLKSTNKREAAQADKFFNSLRIAKEQGFYQ